MRPFLLSSLLLTFSSSALAHFPVETDWQVEHLQGKVKSRQETLTLNPDKDSEFEQKLTKMQFNPQGFLTEELIVIIEGDFNGEKAASRQERHYHYDEKNRLTHRQDMLVNTYTGVEVYRGEAYRYPKDADKQGVRQYTRYKGEDAGKADFNSQYVEQRYDTTGKLLSEVAYAGSPQKVVITLGKYEYQNGKLSQLCEFIESGKSGDCKQYRYLDDGSSIRTEKYYGGQLLRSYFDKHHHKTKAEKVDGDKVVETVTFKNKVDEKGNVLESIAYNEKGEWLSKQVFQYEYY